MKASKSFLTLALVFGTGAAVAAQQLTTVGIVDLAKVTSVFYRESQAFREVEDLTNRVQAELDGITREINSLRSRRLAAEASGNRELTLRLDEEINSKTNFLRDFFRIKNAEIQDRRAGLAESSTFLAEIQKAISFVAEDQGYNVILRAGDPNLLWWSKQVDVTDLVISHLSRIQTNR